MKYLALLVILFLIPGVIASEYTGTLALSNSQPVTSEPVSSPSSGSSGSSFSSGSGGSGSSSSSRSSSSSSSTSTQNNNAVIQPIPNTQISTEIQPETPISQNTPAEAGNSLTGASVVDANSSGSSQTTGLVVGGIIGSLITLLGVAIILRAGK